MFTRNRMFSAVAAAAVAVVGVSALASTAEASPRGYGRGYGRGSDCGSSYYGRGHVHYAPPRYERCYPSSCYVPRRVYSYPRYYVAVRPSYGCGY